MPFLICEKCRGYYELQKGESPDDFESCLCGGTLEYIEDLPEKNQDGNFKEGVIKENSDDANNIRKDEGDKELKSICPNCLKENEAGIFCSRCGGKLLMIKNGRVINKNKDEAFLPVKKDSKTIKSTDVTTKSVKGLDSLLNRFRWFGVFAGVAFLVIGILICFYSVVSMLSWNYSYYGDFDYNDFQFFFNLLIVLILLLGIFSGVLASYINKMDDYVGGLLNGFMVGAISAFILGIYEVLTYLGIMGIFMIFIGIPILGALSSVGGVIGTLLRNKLKDL